MLTEEEKEGDSWAIIYEKACLDTIQVIEEKVKELKEKPIHELAIPEFQASWNLAYNQGLDDILLTLSSLKEEKG